MRGGGHVELIMILCRQKLTKINRDYIAISDVIDEINLYKIKKNLHHFTL